MIFVMDPASLRLLSTLNTGMAHWSFYVVSLFCSFIVIYLYFIFDIKDLIYFCVPCVWYVLCRMQDVCTCGEVRHLYLSAWSVTKHRDRSLSPMGINWVSVSSVEYLINTSGPSSIVISENFDRSVKTFQGCRKG